MSEMFGGVCAHPQEYDKSFVEVKRSRAAPGNQIWIYVENQIEIGHEWAMTLKVSPYFPTLRIKLAMKHQRSSRTTHHVL